MKDENIDKFYIILQGSANILTKKTPDDISYTISLYKKQFEEYLGIKDITNFKNSENYDEEYTSKPIKYLYELYNGLFH